MEAFYEEWKVRPVLICNWTEVISFQSNRYSPIYAVINFSYILLSSDNQPIKVSGPCLIQSIIIF